MDAIQNQHRINYNQAQANEINNPFIIENYEISDLISYLNSKKNYKNIALQFDNNLTCMIISLIIQIYQSSFLRE
jgi:hypothetical protein